MEETPKEEQRVSLHLSSSAETEKVETEIVTAPLSVQVADAHSSAQSASSSFVRKRLFQTKDGYTSLEVARKRNSSQPVLGSLRRRSRRNAPRYRRFNIDEYVARGRPYTGPYMAELLKMHLLHQKQRQPKYTFRNKWIAANIMLAVTMSGYTFMRKLMSLPSPSTVLRFLKQYKMKPGISDFNASIMKVKVNPTAELHKVCFILIDEMSLRAGLDYDRENDVISGFADDGAKRSKKLVKSALCVMAVGIAKKWKYPLGFFLTESAMKAPFVSDVIRKSIAALDSQGFVVKGITSDQGSNLMKAFKILGYSSSDPRIHMDNHSYLVFRDPPHLLKSARNFLLNGDVSVPAFNAFASWKHLTDFFKLDNLRTIKLAPRITAKHLFELKFANKMKVKLASQVLSNSCAAALDLSVALKDLNPSVAATSSFLKKFNDIFDVFNSSSSKDCVPLRKPLALHQSSTASQFLEDAKVWLVELRELNSKRRNHFITGWIENINALSLLKQELVSLDMKYLSLRNLCQDPLELFFGKIRLLKKYPNAKDFCDCFCKVATASLLRAPASSNCEELVSDRLQETNDLLSLVSWILFAVSQFNSNLILFI